MDAVAEAWAEHRSDLERFVRRMVVRDEIAEEIVQRTAERAISAGKTPESPAEMRPWLFRIAANLAIDELRRQGMWREDALIDARAAAEGDQTFIAASESMRSTPEVAAIARQHLSFCFSCTLRTLSPPRAAALLLVEMYGFSVKETAAVLESSVAQAKNWVQEARATLRARYATTCALIEKQGVCYQCAELAGFFNGRPENPLAGTGAGLEGRLRILRATDDDALSDWHRLLVRIIAKRATDLT